MTKNISTAAKALDAELEAGHSEHDDVTAYLDSVDALIEQARAEQDPAKRDALYAQFQQTVMEDACDIFGVLEKRKLAMRNTVRNFRFTPVASNAPELFPLSL